ncbi:unnamed protein product [Camellia sinensis]
MMKISIAGLAADGRQVVARAKSEATNYERLEEKLTNIESENKVLCQQAVSMAPNKILSGRSRSILQRGGESGHLFVDTKTTLDKPQKSLNEKQQENQELLIRCIGQHLGFAGNRPIAACIIYKCLLQWRSIEVERTSVFDRIIQTIGHAIEWMTQEEKDGEVSRVLHLYTAERLSSFGELALMFEKEIASKKGLHARNHWGSFNMNSRGTSQFVKGIFKCSNAYTNQVYLDFSFLEMNPFTLVNGEPYPLDMRAELLPLRTFRKWGVIEFPLPFGRVLSPTESFIHSLDEKVIVASGAVKHEDLVEQVKKLFTKLSSDPTTTFELVAKGPAIFSDFV